MEKLKKLKKLSMLQKDIQEAGVQNYKRYEETIVTLIEECFGEEHNFSNKARKIKSGWEVKSSIAMMYGQASDLEYENDKYNAYVELMAASIEYEEKYGAEDLGGEPILDNKKIFIVHGHDGELKFQVSDWLHRVGLSPIILHLQPNSGVVSIIEKIERNADVGCAIILMTADDLGKTKDGTNLSPRARQNVVFEAGYFIGKLGRSRVVMLYDEGLEAPGDLAGCVYIQADEYGGWKESVRNELSEIGIQYTR